MPLLRRALGSLSRRLERPELVGAFYAGARQQLREEIAIQAVLTSVLRADSTYVDVGTNRGQVLRESVRLAPNGRHIAFEPIPSLAAEVKRSFPGVDCREMALGAERGVAEFCHFRTLDGWSGLRRSPEISDARGDPEYIRVKVSTLDAELGGLRPALVKIDVEGAELEVLTGGPTLLSEVRPVVIFEHVAGAAALYGTTSSAIWDLLADLSYRVFAITGDGPFDRSAFADSTRIVNWLATPGAPTGAR
jgi:FkbM family methyltransferase